MNRLQRQPQARPVDYDVRRGHERIGRVVGDHRRVIAYLVTPEGLLSIGSYDAAHQAEAAIRRRAEH